MTTLFNDIMYACRSLSKQPFHALIVVSVLAIGIAGTTTIFSLFNGILLRPLPVPDQERLVDLDETTPKSDMDYTGLSFPHFHAWRQYNKAFECMAIRTLWWANLSIGGNAERIHGLKATHDLFDVLGIRPLLGRPFTAKEDRPGGPNVLLLSYGLWERLFAKDGNIVGRTLHLDDAPFTIIGVLPPEGAFPEQRDVWLPFQGDLEHGQGIRYGLTAGSGIGRLKKGVPVEQAREDLTRIHQAWLEQHPDSEVTFPTVVDWRKRYLGQYQLPVCILLGVAVLMLLIACCNAAGIILTRGACRDKEVATRVALGATWYRIVQQTLSESLVLSVVAGIVGIPLGHYALEALLTPLADAIVIWMEFKLDMRCVIFCLLVIDAATLLSGLLPALREAFGKNLHSALRTLGRYTTASRERRRALNTIVVTQIALTLTLVIGAGLLLRAFRNVQNVDPGFRTTGILTYHIPLTAGVYVEDSKRKAFWEQHLARIRSLPGVSRASLSNNQPLTWQDFNHFDIEGTPQRNPGEPEPAILTRSVTPAYFETLGIRLLSGRLFTEQDGAQTAIINKSFAKRFWPGEDPIDKQIRLRDSEKWRRVVGVVDDVSDLGLGESIRSSVHLPADLGSSSGMFVLVLTSQDPLSLIGSIREIIRSVDSGLPIEHVQTMSQRVDRSMLLRRLYTWLLAVPAVAASLMAFAGIYAVTSYAVSQRTQEIGIRMALGASVGDVLRMVINQGLRLIVVGLGVGIIGAFVLSRLLASIPNMLYDVSPTDPVTLVGVSLLLVGAAFLACYIPARRATKIDPIEALRYE